MALVVDKEGEGLEAEGFQTSIYRGPWWPVVTPGHVLCHVTVRWHAYVLSFDNRASRPSHTHT